MSLIILCSPSAVIRELIQTVKGICREWDELFDTIEGSSITHVYHAPSSQDGSVGRPRFQISREQLVYLRSLNFSLSAIARLLGVSRYTVYRRRDEFNLSDEPDRTMTDAQLEMRVRELRRELPTLEEALVITISSILKLSSPTVHQSLSYQAHLRN